jgi:hypothetical protein
MFLLYIHLSYLAKLMLFENFILSKLCHFIAHQVLSNFKALNIHHLNY